MRLALSGHHQFGILVCGALVAASAAIRLTVLSHRDGVTSDLFMTVVVATLSISQLLISWVVTKISFVNATKQSAWMTSWVVASTVVALAGVLTHGFLAPSVPLPDDVASTMLIALFLLPLIVVHPIVRHTLALTSRVLLLVKVAIVVLVVVQMRTALSFL
jgi:hypothetical protein